MCILRKLRRAAFLAE